MASNWHQGCLGPLRLAEAAGVLALATDLAMGQPLEHGLHTALLAVRVAEAMGLSEDDQAAVFYGCCDVFRAGARAGKR